MSDFPIVKLPKIFHLESILNGKKWQDEFYWFGSFGEGTIPSYYTLDAQVGYKIPKAKTTVKIGMNNITNNNYITNYGAAIIGRMSHITVTYDQFSN